MRKEDAKCFMCDAPVVLKNRKAEFNEHFRLIAKLMFFLCVALTVASLVTDYVPSFWKCAAATIILHFIRNSLSQTAENLGRS